MNSVCNLPDVLTIANIKETASQVYLQQNKKKEEAESKNCHGKTMLSLEKPTKLI
jgi:hypothetical protein